MLVGLVPPPFLKKLALWLAFAAATTILIGISVSQILIALALGVLLLSGVPLRWPPIAKPLAFFLGWTFVALAFSPDPLSGTDQVRKMEVFLILLVVYSTVIETPVAKWMALAWMAIGTYTAGKGLVQYVRDTVAAREAHADFYQFYVTNRISGFMSHWMTFSGQQLFVVVFLVAFLLFAPDLWKRLWLAIPCAVLVGLSLVLSQTRGVWAAAVAASLYLLWCWRKWTALALPVVLVLGLAVAPDAIKTRVQSIYNPNSKTDSNTHRVICWRTGWAMIQAHPIVGVGPDQIRKPEVFFAYLPSDIRRPLPDGFYEHLHSIYIQYAAERGIPAMLFLVGAVVLAGRDFRRGLSRLPRGRSDERFLLHGSVASVIGALVAGITEYNLNDTEVLTMFLAIMCCGYKALRNAEPMPTPVNAGT
jgi:O-antigen ligase